MLSDIKDIIFIGVPVGIVVYFFARVQFQNNGILKKIEKIPWVYVIGKPSFWKDEYIIYVQDGRLYYEFASHGHTAARKLGRGTWYVQDHFGLTEPEKYEPPIKSVQEFDDYIKKDKSGSYQSEGPRSQVK